MARDDNAEATFSQEDHQVCFIRIFDEAGVRVTDLVDVGGVHF